MSEPEPDDGGEAPTRGRLPEWWRSEWSLRAAGAGLVALAVLLHFAVDGESVALVAWGLGMLGAALALFGGQPSAPVVGELSPTEASTSKPEPPAVPGPARTARIGLGALGLVGFLYGLARVTAAALNEQRASDQWWPVVLGAAALVFAAIWGALADGAAKPMRVAAPATWKRVALALGVAVALGIQVGIPATYYLGQDRFDERFAWRMFSAVRVYRCELSAFDLDEDRARRVELGRTVHVAWINTMRRSREGVLQRYLTWRCETTEGLGGARVINRCTTPEGERVPDVIREIDCASGELISVEVE